MTSASAPKRQRAPVDVFRYRDYREFLAAYYEHKKPGGLSYRSFARAAGVGAPNYLKLVIEGKRNLSPAMAERFATACRLSQESAEYFEVLVAFNQAKGDDLKNKLHERLTRFARFRSSQRLDLAEKEYHSAWYMPAVRELVACPGFVEDTGWIARTLVPNITEKQAAQALEVLQRLGLLERSERGHLVQASRAVSTGQQASGLYIRNYHTEMLQRAIQAIQDVPAEQRYIAALTLSVSPATLREVERRVVEFRKELVALCDTDPRPSQVIELNVQLFPLSQQFSTEPAVGDPATTPSTSPFPAKEAKGKP